MKITVLSGQLKPLLHYCYVCGDSNSYRQGYPNLPSMMLKRRSKKFKDERWTTSKTHEIPATPRNKNNGSKYNLHIHGIFSKIIKGDAHGIWKYHSGYRSSHERLQTLMGKFRAVF